MKAKTIRMDFHRSNFLCRSGWRLVGYLLLLCWSGQLLAGVWTNLPIHDYGMDIDGSNVVAGNQRYNFTTQTLTTFVMPDGDYANIYGIDGNNIAGYSSKTVSGFVYDGSTWTTVHKDGASRTIINDIEGNNLVGIYYDISGIYGFLYDFASDSWTTLSKQGAFTTVVNGISGNNIVGHYNDSSGWHNFLYNHTTKTWNDLNVPGTIYGISGNYLVGTYQSSSDYGWHGFLYDMITQNWTTLDVPGAVNTFIFGIDKNNIVGEYRDSSGLKHGFLYTIPEPASFFLLAIGAKLIMFKRTISPKPVL